MEIVRLSLTLTKLREITWSYVNMVFTLCTYDVGRWKKCVAVKLNAPCSPHYCCAAAAATWLLKEEAWKKCSLFSSCKERYFTFYDLFWTRYIYFLAYQPYISCCVRSSLPRQNGILKTRLIYSIVQGTNDYIDLLLLNEILQRIYSWNAIL